MIMDCKRLISTLKLRDMRDSLLLSIVKLRVLSFSAGTLTSFSGLKLPFVLILQILELCQPAFALSPQAQTLESQQKHEYKNNNSSFAKIILKPGDLKTAAQKKEAGKSSKLSLTEIAKITLYRYFGSSPDEKNKAAKNSMNSQGSASSIESILKGVEIEPALSGRKNGVFVTLSKNGKTRACWGSIYPRESNIARETVLSTLGALGKEYRFKSIKPKELNDLKIQVTVILDLLPVSSFKEVNPLKDGIMVRSGGKSGVILPGEAVDAYYEFVLARLKAGIQPDEACQIYKIKAQIYD